ncbi:tRNA wybutosine-synthesizing protein 3 [Paramyrothecium foliicola]|nr:tRNA wybutosine-synthesizing protein 3 [Paramyrothecium foliicola]
MILPNFSLTMHKTPLPPQAASFVERKARIVQQLAVPEAEYADASPKGSVDAGIREFVDEINGVEGFVTTSSCAGRVSVFLEGRRAVGPDADDGQQVAGVGGKGGGGTWLFVSHEPLSGEDGAGIPRQDWSAVFGLGDAETTSEWKAKGGHSRSRRLIHFKFEPMLLLRCALQAGFRESGAVSLTPTAADEPATPIVAVRSMGLGFESLIGFEDEGGRKLMVLPEYLETLVEIANERFAENTKRIERFRSAFRDAMQVNPKKKPDGGDWEDAAARRERKRAEGLKRREELKSAVPVEQAAATLLHFGLEVLHLLPAVQRTAVVVPQAADNLVAGPLDAVRQRPQLLALLELASQLLDLLADCEAADALVLVVGSRRELLVSEVQSLGFLLLNLPKFLGNAGLDLELHQLGAGQIGLVSQDWSAFLT